MKKITETLIGNLSLTAEDKGDLKSDRLAFLVEHINKAVNPPRRATAQNVNIRAMYLVNDLINSHGGRFRPSGLALLRNLIVDTPVLVGHKRSLTPLGRTFYAELERKGNILWLKSYFYWPKTGGSSCDELLEKIDSGVLKECSISFAYTFPECSACGQDMRTCPHHARFSSNPPGNDNLHFIYRGITQVLETSLVYKGSVKGTYVTDRLSLRGHPQRQEKQTPDDSPGPAIPSHLCSPSKAFILAPLSPEYRASQLAHGLPSVATCEAMYHKHRYLLVRCRRRVCDASAGVENND